MNRTTAARANQTRHSIIPPARFRVYECRWQFISGTRHAGLLRICAKQAREVNLKAYRSQRPGVGLARSRPPTFFQTMELLLLSGLPV